VVKSYRNFYERIYDFENLYDAYLRARRAKRGRPDVVRFDARVEEQLFRLQDELRGETYTPGAYRHFYIHEPKRRKISAAPFRDRVVHHALVAHLEPIWERRFIHHSYACRVGKGTHRALDQCSAWVRRYPYILQCDKRLLLAQADAKLEQVRVYLRLAHDLGLLTLRQYEYVSREVAAVGALLGDWIKRISEPRPATQ
jgi:hypothetical protein